MQLQTANRKKAKIKMALQGPSGAGKTYSALLVAYGLCNDWTKIAVVDTENHSADLYAHLGAYQVLPITAPYTPERYMQAIQVCIDAGIEVLILDSISHEWQGSGGILDIHSAMPGNSFTNWNKVTPRHNAFVQFLLESNIHIIATIRSKQDYVITVKNGKQVPEKVGLKGITREGMDYEFTLVFDVNMEHHAIASKDRTGLFSNRQEYVLSADTGQEILQWCNHDSFLVEERINACKSVGELLQLYQQSPEYQQSHARLFTERRQALLPPNEQQLLSDLKSPQIHSSNALNTSRHEQHTNHA